MTVAHYRCHISLDTLELIIKIALLLLPQYVFSVRDLAEQRC